MRVVRSGRSLLLPAAMSSAETAPPTSLADESERSPKPRSLKSELSPKPRPLIPQITDLQEKTILHPVKGPWLTEKERHHDERIRTLCFVIMACAVMYYLVFTLRDVLVPFFLALSIKCG